MTYHVRLSLKAEQDIARILDWFQEQAAAPAGAKWFANLMDAVDRLEAMPQRCALASEAAELGLEIRELLVGRRHGTHRILFQIENRTVHIVRVWHAARDAVSRGDL